MTSVLSDVVMFHVRRTQRKVQGTVESDDLIQLGLIRSWLAAKGYNGKGTLEGYLHECLWRGYRDVVRGEVRRGTVMECRDELPEECTDHSRPDDEAMLAALIQEHGARLSPLARKVMREFVTPSEQTCAAALARNRRKMHLHRRGVKVNGYDKVKVSPHAVAEGLDLPLTTVQRALTEIRRTITHEGEV